MLLERYNIREMLLIKQKERNDIQQYENNIDMIKKKKRKSKFIIIYTTRYIYRHSYSCSKGIHMYPKWSIKFFYFKS